MASTVVRTVADLQALRDEWKALSALSGSPMLDHDWVVSCAEAFHDERDLQIVVTYERGVLSGAAPLALEARGPGRHLVLLGASRLYEPGGWLFSSESVLAELAAAVIKLGAPLLLHRIPVESRLSGAISALPRAHGIAAVRHASPSLAVNITGTWSEYCAGLSRRTLRKFSDGLARAERVLGAAHIEEVHPLPGDVERLLGMFADLESSGWKGRRGSSIAQRDDVARFLQGYCTRAAERRHLRVTTLSFGSQVAAAELSLDAYGRRWGLKIAFREALAAYSPGLQLVHASIHSAFERGLRAYEFLGSAEDWQRRWKPGTREYHLILVYPWSLSGLCGACRDAGAAFWRRSTSR